MKNRPSRCSLINASLGQRPSRPLFSMPKVSPLAIKTEPAKSSAKGLEQVQKQVQLRINELNSQLSLDCRYDKYQSSKSTIVFQKLRFPDDLMLAYEENQTEKPIVLKGVIQSFLVLYTTVNNQIFFWSLEKILNNSPYKTNIYRTPYPIVGIGFGRANQLISHNGILMAICDPFDIRLYNCYKNAGEIFIQDLHIKIEAQRQCFNSVLFAQGRLFLGSSSGKVRQIKLFKKNFARLRFRDTYSQLKADSQGIIDRVINSQIRTAPSIIDRSLRSHNKFIGHMCYSIRHRIVTCLLSYNMQSINPLTLIFKQQQQLIQKQILIYDISNGLTFIGGINNYILKRTLRNHGISNLSDQAMKISSFQLLCNSQICCNICIITLLFYRLYFQIQTNSNGPKRPLILKVKGVKQPFQFTNLKGVSKSSKVSFDYSHINLVQSSCRLYDDLYLKLQNLSLKTGNIMRISQSSSNVQIQFIQQYQIGSQITICPLISDLQYDFEDSVFFDNSILNKTIRQMHAGCHLIIGFNQQGYWIKIRLKRQDQLCNLLLKSMLIYDKKFIHRQITDINQYTDQIGQLEVCITLLSIICNKTAKYWVQSVNILPHQRSNKKYQQISATTALTAKAIELFISLGQHFINKPGIAGSLIAVKNQAILTFIVRLLAPIYNKPLFTDNAVYKPTFSTNSLHHIQIQLVKLLEFIGSCKSLLRDNDLMIQKNSQIIETQTTVVKRKDFKQKLPTLLQEKDNLKGIQSFARKISQALDLYLLIFQQSTFNVVKAQKLQLYNLLSRLSIANLFLDDKYMPVLLQLFQTCLKLETSTQHSYFAAKYPSFYNKGQFQIANLLTQFQRQRITLKQLTNKLIVPLPMWALQFIIPYSKDCMSFLVQNYLMNEQLFYKLQSTFLQNSQIVKQLLPGIQQCNAKTKLQQLVVLTQQDLYASLKRIIFQQAKIIQQVTQQLSKNDLLQAKRRQEGLISDLDVLKERSSQIEPYIFQKQYYQAYLLCKQIPKIQMSKHHMIKRIVARCYSNSHLVTTDLWPLPVMALIKRISPILTTQQFIQLIIQIQNKNYIHPKFHQPTKYIFQSWSNTQILNSKQNPFWIGKFLVNDMWRRAQQVFTILNKCFQYSIMNHSQQIPKQIFWILEIYIFLEQMKNQGQKYGKKKPQYIIKFLGSITKQLQNYIQKALYILQRESEDQQVCVQFIKKLQFLETQLNKKTYQQQHQFK